MSQSPRPPWSASENHCRSEPSGADMVHLRGLRVLQACAKGITLRKQVKPIIDGLLAAGCHVEAICSRDDDSEWMAENGYVVHFVDMPPTLMQPVRSVAAMTRIGRIISAGHYDVVHSHTPLGALHVNFVAKSAGAPHLFYTVRGVFHIELCNPVKRWMMSSGHLAAIRRADLIFVVAHHIRDYLVKSGLPDDKIVVLPGTGVWHDHLQVPEQQRRQWRRQVRETYGLPPAAPVIVTVCRVVAAKGVGELVRAMRLVCQRVPEARLLVVGDGPDRRRFEELARDEGVAAAVVFAGKQEPERVREFLAAADVFALPSYYREGLPMAPVEAMAMGLPVVLADNPPARELVEHERSGLIVPPKQVEPLAAALVELITDREKAATIAARGQRSSLRYSAPESVRVHLEAYARYFASAGGSESGESRDRVKVAGGRR